MLIICCYVPYLMVMAMSWVKEYERTNSMLIFMDFLKKLDLFDGEHSASYYRRLGMTCADLRRTLQKVKLYHEKKKPHTLGSIKSLQQLRFP